MTKPRPPAAPGSPWRNSRPTEPKRAPAERVVPNDELRLYGLNACRAAFARRPQDLRKVYLSEARVKELRDVLAFCVKHRLGYRVVGEDDLQRLSASRHHEGVCFDLRPPAVPDLPQLLERCRGRPSLLLWLDGVGNPHNLGAVLRSAAHFAVDGLLVPAHAGLALSGAACRVAEGGAEALPLLRMADPTAALAGLREHDYTLLATVPRGGQSLYRTPLPGRCVLVLGAEAVGMSQALLAACAMRLEIPGSGAVESLNIASAAAVAMAEWWRQHAA